jgi:hypothetical protein
MSAPDEEAAVYLLLKMSSHDVLRRQLQADTSATTLELVKNVFLVLLAGIAIVLGMAILAYLISLFADKFVDDENDGGGGVLVLVHQVPLYKRQVSWVFVQTSDGSFSNIFLKRLLKIIIPRTIQKTTQTTTWRLQDLLHNQRQQQPVRRLLPLLLRLRHSKNNNKNHARVLQTIRILLATATMLSH